jgi:hypothetical protein
MMLDYILELHIDLIGGDSETATRTHVHGNENVDNLSNSRLLRPQEMRSNCDSKPATVTHIPPSIKVFTGVESWVDPVESKKRFYSPPELSRAYCNIAR